MNLKKKILTSWNDCVDAIKTPITGGWLRYISLVLLGAVSALGQAPHYWWAVFLLSFGTFFHWISKASYAPKRNFLDGWCFGFGFFIAGLYWIAGALLVPGQDFKWLVPFAVIGIPALLAVTTGLVTLAFAYGIKKFPTLSGVRQLFIFASLWALLEIIRGTFIFNGFPWNIFGNAAGFSETLLQLANLFGAYGLSFVIVVIAVGATLWVRSNDKVAGRIALGFLAVWIAYGWAMLPTTTSAIMPGVRLRLVQPNIPQEYKWEEKRKLLNISVLAELSKLPAGIRPTHIVWPEAAVAFQLERSLGLSRALASIVQPGGYLITGGPRSERSDDKDSAYTKYFNSVLVLNHKGDVVAHYDKSHLVPFGEYVPLRWLLPMKTIANGMQDFSPGRGAETVQLQRTPSFSPLVCYEIIFPGSVVNNRHRPRWILNVTNDAWYGNTSGPYQHFDMAKLRAVEEGIPVVRVANTGISGVIDAYGRVVASVGLNQQGVIDANLPTRRVGRTLFSRFGTAGVALSLSVILLLSLGIARVRALLNK